MNASSAPRTAATSRNGDCAIVRPGLEVGPRLDVRTARLRWRCPVRKLCTEVVALRSLLESDDAAAIDLLLEPQP